MAISFVLDLLPLEARTATIITKEFSLQSNLGVAVVINITAGAGGGGAGLIINLQDRLPIGTGEFLTTTSSPIFNANQVDFITVRPGIAESQGGNNQRFNRVNGDILRVEIEAQDGTSITYSLGIAVLI